MNIHSLERLAHDLLRPNGVDGNTPLDKFLDDHAVNITMNSMLLTVVQLLQECGYVDPETGEIHI